MTYIKIRSILGIVFLLLCLRSFSQEITFINLAGENKEFREGTEIYGTLQADRKESFYFRTKTGKIHFGDFSFDSVVTLTVQGVLIKEYTNQYTPEQFQKLDTIPLYQTNRFYEPTPRVFLNKQYSLDSAIRCEAAILKDFLENTSIDSTFLIQIYHSRALKKSDKKRINQVKTTFCKEVGVDEKDIQLIDKKCSYSTVRFDFFNPGSIVTDYFIKNQNTPWMKAKAEEYSLALVVEIVWSKILK